MSKLQKTKPAWRLPSTVLIPKRWKANAEKLRAQELVNQFKQEMGKSVKSSEKTISIDDQPDEPTSEKTVGKKDKTKS